MEERRYSNGPPNAELMGQPVTRTTYRGSSIRRDSTRFDWNSRT